MAMHQTTREGAKAVLKPNVDVVASSVPDLRAELKSLLASGVTEVVVDLSVVSAVDSTGIGLMVSTYNSLSKLGGKFSINNASKDLLELFRSMRIDRHFPVSGV